MQADLLISAAFGLVIGPLFIVFRRRLDRVLRRVLRAHYSQLFDTETPKTWLFILLGVSSLIGAFSLALQGGSEIRLDILIGSAVSLGIGLVLIVYRVPVAEAATKLLRISYGDLFSDKASPAVFAVLGVGSLIISTILLFRGVGTWA